MFLQVGQLHAGYGKKDILKDIQLHIQEKEFVGIVGPNGCGKSTLLKTMYRVLKPTAGWVNLEGESLLEMPYKESAKKLGVVAQQQQASFDFTVEELILLGRTPYKKLFESNHRKDYEKLQQVLEQLDLVTYAKRSFNALSGGERQRVLLARALIQEPECLMLDEPTNHMDIKHQLTLLSLVKGMPVTVLTVLHDLNLAVQYCDRLYVMKDGNVVASGKPMDVLTTELIRDVYDVEAKYLYDAEMGRYHIIYHDI